MIVRNANFCLHLLKTNKPKKIMRIFTFLHQNMGLFCQSGYWSNDLKRKATSIGYFGLPVFCVPCVLSFFGSVLASVGSTWSFHGGFSHFLLARYFDVCRQLWRCSRKDATARGEKIRIKIRIKRRITLPGERSPRGNELCLRKKQLHRSCELDN